MTNTNETKATLSEKTVAELRAICKSRGITGMTKKRKDIIVQAILDNNKATKMVEKGGSIVDNPKKSTPTGMTHSERMKQLKPEEPVTAAQFGMTSILTNPSAKVGDKTTTTITVSCGANSADFPVVGKTVGAVQTFLAEVLNVSSLAEGQVNGEKVESNYVLQTGDSLEFIKPAGRKG